MFRYALTYIFFIVLIEPLFAREYQFNDDELQNVLEAIARKSRESNIIDRIESFISNPVELKTSSVEDIAQIPTITYTLAREIKKLAVGGATVNQIINKLKLDREKAYLLRYCTYIDMIDKKKKTFTKLKFVSRTRIIEQFNNLKGYEKVKFQGNITDIYQRFIANYGGYSGGVLLSKDLGEKYTNSFISGFLNLKFGELNINAGDFYVQTGLGNILWTQNTFGKGAEVISSAYQYDNSTYSYKSSSEFGYFRGLALSNLFPLSRISALKVSARGAYTPRSGSISDNDSIITSLYRAGLFRTKTEIAKQNNIYEKMFNGDITFQHKSFNIGVAGLYLDYDKPVYTSSSFAINGKDALLSTMYFVVPLTPLSFSGEISADGHKNMAYKFIAQLSRNDYSIILHGRSFAAGFRSPYGYMFGEQSNPANEYGLYCGFVYKGWKNVKAVAYIDYYGSYGKTYYLPEPMRGLDVFSQTLLKIDKNNEVLLRLQYENKTDSKKINGTKEVFQRGKYYIRTDYTYHPVDNIRLRGRLDLNLINFENILPDETGFAGYVEIRYKVLDELDLTSRFAYFSTDSYESAIWQYEYTLPGYLYMPPLYGQGFRTYISAAWLPFKEFVIRARWLIMKKHNVATIGSGYNEILSNTDNRFYVQLDIKL